MIADKQLSPALNNFLPVKVEITTRGATSLESNRSTSIGKYFGLPDLYFAEVKDDNKILKQGLSGDIVKQGTIVFDASNTDWSLFNQSPENRKCAQIVLYEHLKKPQGVAMVNSALNNAQLSLSTIDYKIPGKETADFWKNVFAAMRIKTYAPGETDKDSQPKKQHDLLLDGPVNQ
jgi:beta-galactosidase